MSTNRKKSSVESATTSSKQGTKCHFCKGIGHNKASCNTAKGLGKRLTASTWALINTVQASEEQLVAAMVDPMVPRDAMALRITGKAIIGASTYLRGEVYLSGLRVKESGPPCCWVESSVLGAWTNNGRSSAHYVFLANM